MKLEIDVERWAEALGPAVILMAYFDTNNARDWETWHQLVADDATHTANVDTSGLSVRPLKGEILEGVVEAMPDVHVHVTNVYSLSSTIAYAEWETTGSLRTGARYENTGFIRFELNEEGKVQNVKVAELSLDAIELLREADGIVENQ